MPVASEAAARAHVHEASGARYRCPYDAVAALDCVPLGPGVLVDLFKPLCLLLSLALISVFLQYVSQQSRLADPIVGYLC